MVAGQKAILREWYEPVAVHATFAFHLASAVNAGDEVDEQPLGAFSLEDDWYISLMHHSLVLAAVVDLAAAAPYGLLPHPPPDHLYRPFLECSIHRIASLVREAPSTARNLADALEAPLESLLSGTGFKITKMGAVVRSE